jgi:hypothetical protein
MASPERTIQAYSVDGETAQCMRCERILHTNDIAMFIRSRPTDAFSAWCAACTHWVVIKAAEGLEAEGVMAVTVLF